MPSRHACNETSLQNPRRAGVDVWLLSVLFAAATEFARSQQVRICYAIMPPYVTKLLARFGVRMEPIESKLNTENPVISPILKRFSLYWHHSRPKLYHLPGVPVPIADLSDPTQNLRGFAERALKAGSAQLIVD